MTLRHKDTDLNWRSRGLVVHARTSSCRCGSCPTSEFAIRDEDTTPHETRVSYNIGADYKVVGINPNDEDCFENNETLFNFAHDAVAGLGAVLHALNALARDPKCVPTPEAWSEFCSRLSESQELSDFEVRHHDYKDKRPAPKPQDTGKDDSGGLREAT